MPTKILAIDDSKTMRLAIKITFAAEDADVTSVSKGSEAVARAKQMSADVVLVDASLAAGEPSGYEVCRALKQDPATANVPVVILASNQTGIDEAQLAAAGGDGWLAKPFDTQELIDKVAEVQGQPAAQPTAAATAAPAPARPVAATPPATRPASGPAAAAARPARPGNRTQMGMPSPGRPGTPEPAAAPAPAPAPAQKTVVGPAPEPPRPARPVAAPPPAAGPPRSVPPRRPITGPNAAVPRPAAPAPARPAAQANPAAAASGGPIPIAIPIPFTAADAPTPGMAARIAQAAGSAGVDPKVAEALASLSRDVVERIVWEVVPDLAESIIREHQAKSA